MTPGSNPSRIKNISVLRISRPVLESKGPPKVERAPEDMQPSQKSKIKKNRY
jgi:hypothetical protein